MKVGGDSETLEAFMAIAEGDADRIVESDVDGLKGDFGLRDGRVVRICGDVHLPYTAGAAGLRAIAADGAYALRNI